MTETMIGSAAFILYMLYDIGQVKEKQGISRYFFTIGTGLICLMTILLLRKEASLPAKPVAWMFLLGAVFFLGLLIYTLFFALPFENTYVAQDVHKTYDKKIYALCRHPGVLWFAGFYFCLWFAFGGKSLFWMAVCFSFLNFCYIILQDFYTFPRIFSDYGDYKKRVPFLIPNGKSLRRCFDTFKESR